MSKKPAKKNTSNTSAPVVKVDTGINILYIGAAPSVKHVCPECGSITGRGIIREYQGKTYCSKGCVLSVKRSEVLA